jgi:hypothetical protein
MKLNRFIAVFAVVLLAGAFSVSAQVVNANLTGTVTMDNNPLPGVTVTISSPNMQGTRTTTTDVNGNYNFGAIPAGTYKVVFEMQGMQNATRNVQIGVGQTGRADATMHLTAVAEAITVTASAPAVLETTEISTNLQQSTINKLPTSRTVTGVALLAPGTTSSGPRGALVISGATADQNLITVDGAVIQENLRGQTHGLFIEDAIQETTVLTGAISAEYGRFTGGVVNSITKSGGNEFHGSYRDNIDKPSWTATTPFPGDVKGPNITNQVHEATVGGRVIRDRLWFFAAGRKTKSSSQSPFSLSPAQFNVATDAKRYEGKLTGQITPKHSLVATYLDSPLTATNNCQLGCLEPQALDPSIQQGNNFYTGHYNGILTNNWLVEALYSRKTFAFIGFGGENRDNVAGSPLLAFNSAFTSFPDANAPYFCGVCGNEKRNNNSWNAKSTYFWSTKNWGTHNIVGGYERWSESRFSNNYQSPTNFVLNTYQSGITHAADGTTLFTLTKDTDWLVYYPILTPSLGSDLRTKSLFVNDKWDFNTHLNLNVGARYDKNDAVNSLHQAVSKDSNVSPRFGLNYDVLGNGKYRLTAAYNVYVGRLAEGVTSASSPAGSPASFYYQYEGPTLTGITSHQYAQAFFDWLNSVGGISKLTPFFTSIPGAQTIIRGSLKSPNVREYTVGGGMQIGNGFVRADVIDRDWKDFYVNVRNASTGTVVINGAPADLTLIANSNDLKRNYKALELQGQYRLFANLQLGGNYTYSRLKGNAVQENAGSGPISEGFSTTFYPEFANFPNNAPIGYLPSDQTHKVRLWASYDLHTFLGNLNLGAIERVDSGLSYSETAAVNTSWENITNAPAYATPPTTETYFFSKRGAFRTAALRATDLSATFSFPTFHGAEVYVEGYAFNAFNAHSIVNVTSGAATVLNTTVLTARNSACGTKFGQSLSVPGNVRLVTCQPFNPFTGTPVEFIPGVSPTTGTYNFERAYDPATGKTLFGTPTSKSAYQNPRSYSMAVGIRF